MKCQIKFGVLLGCGDNFLNFMIYRLFNASLKSLVVYRFGIYQHNVILVELFTVYLVLHFFLSSSNIRAVVHSE